MAKVVCFGELMMRLTPERYYRIGQTNQLEATFGGAEANVSVSLSNFGIDSEFVSKLPDNKLGDVAVNELRKFGVETKHITRGGERLGIYFMERGVSQRSSLVIYDRKYSSISTADQSDFDWDEIFDGADWFHFTGITPALGKEMPNICLIACKEAKRRNIKISFDINYRKKLWNQKTAFNILSTFMKYVDICIANEEDASEVFGINAPDTNILNGKIEQENYEYVAKELKKIFSLEAVAITLRTSYSASKNGWSGILYKDGAFYSGKEYNINIVDRVGGGDAFGAGLIFGLISGYDNQKTIDFALAASCLQQTVEGDFNQCTKDEVLNLMNGNISGRIIR